MGMAASQARLLMLTSRLHDVELKAQQLQNAKLQLSTQQDAVYEDYQKALDATTLTAHFADRTAAAQSDVAATFSNLFSLGAAADDQITSNYILVDSRGRVVVDDEVAEGYNNYVSAGGGDMHMNNAYQFAWFMVEGQHNGHSIYANNGGNYSNLEIAIDEVFEENKTELMTLYNNACEKLYAAYGSLNPSDPNYVDPNDPTLPDYETGGWWNPNWGEPKLSRIFTFSQWENGSIHNPFTDDEKKAFNDLINYFWSHYGQQVFNKVEENNQANINGDEYNKQEFDYYVRIYNAIQQHGGCISIEDYNGPDGSAATNSEWLTAMLQSGQMSLETISIDNHGEATLAGTSVASDTNLTYTTTTQIDKVAMAKAEAEYEHAMKVIDRKEQKIDLELKKIETERTAITKEYDSIKKVSDDNIDRTFGIFS